MSSSFDRKLASVVAGRIANEILRRGWRVGASVGIESSLLQRLGISREPFREAVRILEWQGIVRARRGAAGGLIIQAPSLTAISSIIRTYLELSGVSYDEVHEAHTLVLIYGLGVAVARMTPVRANEIRKLSRALPSGARSRNQEGLELGLLHHAVLEAANIPSLSMLEYAISRLTADFGHQERYPADVWKPMIARVRTLTSAMALRAADRDLPAARRALLEIRTLVDDTVRRLERYNHRVWNTRSFLGGDYRSAAVVREPSQKAATHLLYRIAAHIRRSELVPGTTLGTEAQLMRKFSASRAVFREAVRSLEFFGVATVKRGGAGGLTVSVPDPSATIDCATLYLKYLRGNKLGNREFLGHLELEAMRLAAMRVTHSDLTSVVEAAGVAARAKASDLQRLAVQARRRVIAMSGNRVLEFMTTLLAVAGIRHGDRVASPAQTAKGRRRLQSACRAVQRAAAGDSADDLGSVLYDLYSALGAVSGYRK